MAFSLLSIRRIVLVLIDVIIVTFLLVETLGGWMKS